MLIVPVISKSGRKHIPYLVLFLILINCIVYFLFQADDSRLYSEATNYYQESGLLGIELSAYKEYLKEHGNWSQLTEEDSPYLAAQMLDDNSFIQQLEHNQIITKKHADYSDWRGKRDQYEGKLKAMVSYRFGYSPIRENRIALFTCMFLHASVMHLVGNMIFLYLVGALLEVILGPFFFLLGYLVTGICASWLFGFVYPLTPGPLVGASGAIAGLMGAYTVLFWLRKVTVFYSLGFYFDYAKVPAIVLLPLWLGTEFFQLFLNKGSHVAYMAHVGGLVSGSLLATCHKLLKKDSVDSLFKEDDKKESITIHMEKGLDKMARLEFKRAKREFMSVLAIQPDNRTAMRYLFHITRTDPESDTFHGIAKKLLLSVPGEDDQQFIEIYQEYRQKSPKPRLSSPILLRLTRISLRKKMYNEAEMYLAETLKKDCNTPNLPILLMRLAEGYNTTGNNKKARVCLNILAKQFSASEEGGRAKEILAPRKSA